MSFLSPLYIYKLYLSPYKATYRELRNLLGFVPGKVVLYKQALTHHSVAKAIHPSGEKDSNERLEYLGDAILDTVVAEMLFIRFPLKDEGFLTEMRAKIVSREQLADLARKMGITNMVSYDQNQRYNPQFLRTIAGNAFEAMIGAIYLDKGFDYTRKYIIRGILNTHLDIDHLESLEVNFKSKLHEWAQKNKKELTFDLKETTGHAHKKTYTMCVVIDGKELAEGIHVSKKKAEQIAAEKACAGIGI